MLFLVAQVSGAPDAERWVAGIEHTEYAD